MELANEFLAARIVVTLVLSITCVVVMATATLILARQGYVQKEQHDCSRLVSEAILLIAPLFGDDENGQLVHCGAPVFMASMPQIWR